MNITLKDIAESEKICEAAIPEPGVKQQVSVAYRTENQLAFEDHARIRLPAMNKLALEMLHALKFYADMDNYRCIISGGINGSEVANDFGDEARRLVERMDGEPTP